MGVGDRRPDRHRTGAAVHSCVKVESGRLGPLGRQKDTGRETRGLLACVKSCSLCRKDPLDVLDLSDDVLIIGGICRCPLLVHGRHGAHRAAKVNRERRGIVGATLGDLVRGVDHHPSLGDEWQAQDDVDGDVASRCHDKACGVALAGQIREVELETHRQIRGNRFSPLLDDAAQCNRGVVVRAVNRGNGMRVSLCNFRKEVKIARR